MPSWLSDAIADIPESIAFPWPQLLPLDYDYFALAFADKLYIGSFSGQALTPISFIDVNGDAATLPSGTYWTSASFGPFWMLWNGAATVWSSIVDPTTWYCATEPLAKVGIRFRGRILMGNLGSGDFWNSDWQDIYRDWTKQHVSPPSGVAPDSLGADTVTWCSIGGGDVLDPYIASRGILGAQKLSTDGHDASFPIFLDHLYKNESGFMNLPRINSVVDMHALKDHVIVFGDRGVAALTPYNNPIPTFGQRPIVGTGIAAPGALAGNEEYVVFIDTAGILWRINNDLTLAELGYQEFLQGDFTQPVRMSFDPQRDVVHLAGDFPLDGVNTAQGYLLDRDRLWQYPAQVCGGMFIAGAFQAVVASPSDTVSRQTLRTNYIHMDNRLVKTIQSIHVCGRFSNCELSVRYRYDSGQSMFATPWTPIGPDGIVNLLVSGVEFQIAIRGGDYNDIEWLDHILINWSFDGKRSMATHTLRRF